MPSFVDVTTGKTPAAAADIQQIIDALKGTAGKGIPLSLTAVNDAINFALSVKNNDAGASKALVVYKADGTVLFQVDKNGVVASPDGIAAASQIPTLTGTQTLTNKTLAAPHFTSPVVDSGGLTITLGGVNITGAITGAGTGGLGVWTTFTPTMGQSVGITLSTATGRYMQLGKFLIGQIVLAANSAGTAGNLIQVGGLPVAGRSTGDAVGGSGLFLRSGGPNHNLKIDWNGATNSFLFYAGAAATGIFGINPAVTIAAGDTLKIGFWYETA